MDVRLDRRRVDPKPVSADRRSLDSRLCECLVDPLPRSWPDGIAGSVQGGEIHHGPVEDPSEYAQVPAIVDADDDPSKGDSLDDLSDAEPQHMLGRVLEVPPSTPFGRAYRRKRGPRVAVGQVEDLRRLVQPARDALVLGEVLVRHLQGGLLKSEPALRISFPTHSGPSSGTGVATRSIGRGPRSLSSQNAFIRPIASVWACAQHELASRPRLARKLRWRTRGSPPPMAPPAWTAEQSARTRGR